MPHSVRDVIGKSAAYLAGAGLHAARLEAELLVGRAVGLDRTQLYVQFDRPVHEDELSVLRPLLLARARDRTPLAYLTGHKSFLGIDLLVPTSVFIPRPETEELAEAVVANLSAATRVTGDDGLTILDLCTGTGAIALALARRFPGARVLATDLDPEAVEAARLNTERLGLAGRVTVFQGDLWAALPAGARCDVIVSNPPYIPRAALKDLPPEIRRHEPMSALDGGEDGLEFYRRIMEELERFLQPGGLLGLEHGDDQADAIRRLAVALGLVALEALTDLAGRPRILLARREAGPSFVSRPSPLAPPP